MPAVAVTVELAWVLPMAILDVNEPVPMLIVELLISVLLPLLPMVVVRVPDVLIPVVPVMLVFPRMTLVELLLPILVV